MLKTIIRGFEADLNRAQHLCGTRMTVELYIQHTDSSSNFRQFHANRDDVINDENNFGS